ncbi:MAG TPA: hypothetical protein VGI20_04775 [Rhizomicrobium sp.]|jgi:hypothetical protein
MPRVRVFDPSPDAGLKDIFPLSVRSLSLLARAHTAPGVQEHALSLHGAVTMLQGLDYHYSHMVTFSELYREGRVFHKTEYGHEVDAYLNQLGRLYYFFACGLGKHCGIDVINDIPSILRYIPLRHKHAAHRSIDLRRGESDEFAAFQLIGMSGNLRRPRPDSMASSIGKDSDYLAIEAALRESLPVYQLQITENNEHRISFCPEVDHVTIMADAYEGFAKVVSVLQKA